MTPEEPDGFQVRGDVNVGHCGHDDAVSAHPAYRLLQPTPSILLHVGDQIGVSRHPEYLADRLEPDTPDPTNPSTDSTDPHVAPRPATLAITAPPSLAASTGFWVQPIMTLRFMVTSDLVI